MRVAVATRFLSGLALLAIALVLPSLARQTTPVGASQALHFALCAEVRAASCVVDGDTIHWQGQTIRLQDIDAPEIHDFKCAAELALGMRATRRLHELLNAAPVQLLHTGARDEDRYGRMLRIVSSGRHSLGAILVAEGLARRWDGTRHGWCA